MLCIIFYLYFSATFVFLLGFLQTTYCCVLFFFLNLVWQLAFSWVFWLPCGSAGKESACNAGDLGFDPWVGKIPLRRERLPTPVYWPGEFHGLFIVHGVTKSWIWQSDFHYHFTLDHLCVMLLLICLLVRNTFIFVLYLLTSLHSFSY